METRKPQQSSSSKPSPLPGDYLQMIADVFTTNFDADLRQWEAHQKKRAYFQATGWIFAEEIVLCISLLVEGQLAATSVHCSCDFDARASAPTIQDLLSACVDAAGAQFTLLFSDEEAATKTKAPGPLTSPTLSAFKDIPFGWTLLKLDRHPPVHVKMDKANPTLDEAADQWLNKHDPEFRKKAQTEEKETEALFVTGKKGQGGSPSGH